MTKIKTKNLSQSAVFKAGAHDVYELLMDSKKHSQFSGGKADISRKEGGKFTAYDGYADGKNLELVPDKKIVQTWRASDWPEGHYSKITYSLSEKAGKTTLKFKQDGIPAEFYNDIKQGWQDYYWKPMKEMLK